MRKKQNNSLEIIQSPLLSTYTGLLHFTTTRSGGISTGEYNSLNLGAYCGDKAETVTENRLRLCRALSLSEDKLFVPYQIHKDRILEIDEVFLASPEEKQMDSLHGVDALITRLPDVCIAVTTADCVPVLLYAPDKKVVAAVHAGWRGTLLQITHKVVRRLIEKYDCDPQQLIAGIGPSISQENYEVGNEVVEAFLNAGSGIDKIFRENPQTGNPHVDVGEANRLQLIEAGLLSDNIDRSAICTFANPEYLFSARRQGIQSGRMLSGMMVSSSGLSAESKCLY